MDILRGIIGVLVYPLTLFFMFAKITKKDSKDSEWNRKWEYRPSVGYKPFLFLGIDGYLIQFKGEPCERLFYGQYIGFQWNIKKWEISQDYTWYDGPNCSWQFGPFIYSITGHGDCKKCRGEIE